MTGPSALILSVIMMAGFALEIGAFLHWRRSRKPPWLMVVAGLVLIGNVLIWTL